MSEQRQRPTAKEESSRIEELLGSEVMADAERRAERIIQRAERDAEGIRRRGQQQGRGAAEEILQAARQRAEHASNAVLATVAVEAHKAELAAQEEAIDACLTAAYQQALEKDGYDYHTVLVELAAAAVVQMPGDRFRLCLMADDAQLRADGLPQQVEAAVKERTGRTVQVELAGEHPRIAGGCIVLSADGRLRYDNSFEGRLRRQRDLLRRVAARELFDERGGEP